MIFGVLNPEKIWHQWLLHFPTSPVYCIHFTLGNPKKSFFNNIFHTCMYFGPRIIFVISEGNKLLFPYPLHLKNVTALPCKMYNFFHLTEGMLHYVACWIIFVIAEENKLFFPYPPHLKNVTAVLCIMHKFFIWLKVCCIPPHVCGSERKLVVGWHWWLWKKPVVMYGKWNVRQPTLAYSKCSKWPPSARIHASSLCRRWSTASSTALC